MHTDSGVLKDKSRIWYVQVEWIKSAVGGEVSITGLKDQRLDGDRRALSSPVAVVEVVKAATEALVEDVGTSEGQAAVTAERKARGIDCTGLGWCIELKLEVGCNVASPTLGIFENAVV